MFGTESHLEHACAKGFEKSYSIIGVTQIWTISLLEFDHLDFKRKNLQKIQ